MKLRLSLVFSLLLIFTMLLVNQAGIVSSAAIEESAAQSIVMADASTGISITGPITTTKGISITYTITYSDVVATGGVKYQFDGIDADKITVNPTPAASDTDGDDLIWAFEDIGADGTITLEVTHNDCGSISHTVWLLDTHDDPFSERKESSISTLIDCDEEPPEDPTCDGVTVTSVASGEWDDTATWDNGVPGTSDVVHIKAGHVIEGRKTWIYIESLCNDGVLQSQLKYSLLIRAKGFVINSNNADILGQNGVDNYGSGCGTRGSTVQISPHPSDDDGVEITNDGIIRAGNGGNGICTGLGGSVSLLGRNTTNGATGQINSGHGGDLTGDANNRSARDGGNIFIFGNFKGSGTLTNEGFIMSGRGGNANVAATNRQHGGDGGCIVLISQPFVNIYGPIIAGIGGMGAAGGANGSYGCVIIDPEGYMDFNENARVSGGDIQINGGDNWTVDMSDIGGATPVISATGSITVAVGDGGVIDLTGNNTTVLRADGEITFYAGEDGRVDESLRLDDGVVIGNVATSPDGAHTASAHILRDISVSAPEVMPGEVEVELDIDIVVQNLSVATDTISIVVTDTERWGVTPSIDEVAVNALSGADVVLNITPPANPSADRTTIMVTITSQEDPTLLVTQEIEVLLDFVTAVTLTDADAIAGANWYLPALALLLVAGLLLASGRMVLVTRKK
jgi:hypothetical protein